MKRGPSLHGDKISDIPANIIETILSRLSIREAVRTCILSKKWRYNWVTLPELIFDCSLGDDLINQNDKLARFIDGVLLNHRGPICKFKISHLWIPNSPDIIDKWMLCVSRNYIQKLILRLQPQFEHYELLASLYSCEQLTHLEVSFCTLRSPPMLACFKSLRSLFLYKVDCIGFTFEDLISRCPILERLMIDGFTDSTDLIINAPKLQELVVDGFCKVTQNICFKNTPLLAYVSLNLQCFGFEGVLMNHKQDGISRLMKVFGSLVGLEMLSVGGNFLKFFVADLIPKRLSNTFYHLKKLDLEICFNDLHMISVGLCLIRSAPNLHKLQIDAGSHVAYVLVYVDDILVTSSDSKQMFPHIDTEFWEVQDGREFSLNHLQNVIITSFYGLKPQLEFVKFLLTITPALEKISIHGFKEVDDQGHLMDGSSTLKELMQLPRVSMKAQIEYFEIGELVELGNE
ncbi:F-box/FBD/LRR-repeat protein At1g13570-like [Telopea speciosissima]|uniref:F-box/FBD/LRR-repeat protein At1g13570-like n=1 Tax=Telopea speciosissima TaxID=54955 RepID=UPI001CC5A349|nr:F-box/FBD/LRR-repeat protein At1g13570-like [Telopea speciosissima]